MSLEQKVDEEQSSNEESPAYAKEIVYALGRAGCGFLFSLGSTTGVHIAYKLPGAIFDPLRLLVLPVAIGGVYLGCRIVENEVREIIDIIKNYRAKED